MIKLPIEIGDTILTGKFRNHKMEVKEIGVDEWGHPTVNGKPILKIRIEKLMLKKEAKMNRLLGLLTSTVLLPAFTMFVFGVLVSALLGAAVPAVKVAAKVVPAGQVDKVVVEKSVVSDTSKVVLMDTLLAVRHDTVKVIKTWRDTVKLVKKDSVVTSRVDTLWTKKYSRGK